MTSTQAVGAVRRVIQAAKAGHGGTLDPLATGLLPIALGEATKTVPYVMDGTKTYRFTLRLGEARATDDAEGEVSATSDRRPEDGGNPGRAAGLHAAGSSRARRPIRPSRWPASAPMTWPGPGETVDLAPAGDPDRALRADRAARRATMRFSRSCPARAPICAPRPRPRRGAGDRRPCRGAPAHRRRPLHARPMRFRWIRSRPWGIVPPPHGTCYRSRPRWTTSRRWPLPTARRLACAADSPVGPIRRQDLERIGHFGSGAVFCAKSGGCRWRSPPRGR